MQAIVWLKLLIINECYLYCDLCLYYKWIYLLDLILTCKHNFLNGSFKGLSPKYSK